MYRSSCIKYTLCRVGTYIILHYCKYARNMRESDNRYVHVALRTAHDDHYTSISIRIYTVYDGVCIISALHNNIYYYYWNVHVRTAQKRRRRGSYIVRTSIYILYIHNIIIIRCMQKIRPPKRVRQPPRRVVNT